MFQGHAVVGRAFFFFSFPYFYFLANSSLTLFIYSSIHSLPHLSVEQVLGTYHELGTEDAKMYDIIALPGKLDSARICTDV